MPRINDTLGKTIDEARKTWLSERARFDDVKQATYKLIIQANEAGVSEQMLATLFEIDRGTVRKILGKERKQ